MLTGKWTRINGDCQKLNAIYKHLKRKSEENEADHIEAAKITFAAQQPKGRKFQLEHCWRILKGHSKWDTPKPLDTEDHIEIFGPDVRPRPASKTRPAKKTKSETTESSGGSALGSLSDCVSEDLRRKLQARTSAYEAKKAKEIAMIEFKEIEFLTIDAHSLPEPKASIIRNRQEKIITKYTQQLSESSGNQLFSSANLGNSLTDYLASDPLLEQWDMCNAVVLNWILSSLSQEVYLGHVFSNNAATVWNELKDTYDRIDGSIVSNLLQKTNSFKQGGLPVSEYCHKLNSLWKEYEILTKLPDCTCNARLEVANYDKMLKLMQEESYRGIPSSSGTVKTEKAQASAFVSKQSDMNRSRNNTWSNNENNVNRGVYDNLLCKNCGLKGHTIDRCVELIGYPPGFKRNLNLKHNTNGNSKSNSGDFRKGSFNNSEIKASGNVSFTNEQVMKLMSLLNDKGSAGQSNMAGITKCSFFNCNVFFNQNFYKFFCTNVTINGVNYRMGWIIDSGANQHMNNSIKDMVNLVDVFDLKLTVGHPNGTLAKITHVGNLKLNNDVMLFDVLVIPEYTVSLLSVHKLIKDSKFSVGFNETKCYIQGLKKGRVLGTGSEFSGLYLFNKEYNKSTVANNSKFVSCFVSKEVWHCRLGHPANQVLKLLKGSLNLSNIDHGGPCKVCHKAKQTRDSFPLSENKSTVFGQLMNLDVWGPYKMINREGFRYFLTIVDDYSSPNDDEEGSSCRDGSVHQSGPSHSLDQPEVDEQIPTSGSWSDLQGSGNDGLVTTTPIDENTSFEGNVGFNDRKPIGSKWVFKIKYKSDGEVVAIQNEWDIYQMDINNAFLYGDLIEEVYMLPPLGFFNLYDKRACTSKVEIAKFKHFLSNRFKIKDLGELKYFLGIEVLKVSGSLCLSQMKSDISYAVHYLSQHMHAPLKSHFDIALRLLKYLKLALGFGVQFVKRQGGFDIKAFSDSGWAKCPVTRKAEYRSMAAATYEIMWIVKIMSDLNIKNLLPAELYCDNKTAMQIDTNPIMHEKTKHFNLDVHFIRERGLMELSGLYIEKADLGFAYFSFVRFITKKVIGVFLSGSFVLLQDS
uniref:Ribonuclease H-like domain-containing protein n=1 Tax=Tanacetum cinerariifolium TaxID=118510 RepID=A0A699GW70_TANCI|nr:ribonuclease H-like domain-containing protein [Tanacetum cinerariifolium]